MKSHTEYLSFETKEPVEFINITKNIQASITKSNIQEGLVLVNSMHITSSVFINDAEDGLIQDFQRWLEELAPFRVDYQHHNTGEENADAHLKRTIMGREVVCAITKGKLDFGPWEQIYYAEFDGQRPKKVLIKILGE